MDRRRRLYYEEPDWPVGSPQLCRVPRPAHTLRFALQPMQLFAASIIIALTALGTLPVAAQPQGNSTDARAQELLRRVLVAVAAQPLESRGTLRFKPHDVIKKRTTHPNRETVTIAAETVTVDAGNGTPPQVFSADADAG